MATKKTEEKAFEKFDELLNEIKCLGYNQDGTTSSVENVGRTLDELNSMFRTVFPKSYTSRQYYEQGYNTWNNNIKHNLKKLSEFINFCGSIERGEPSNDDIRPDMTKYVVINREIRFPAESDDELYLDVRSVRVKTQMMYIDELMKNNLMSKNGLTKSFLDFVKNDIYTRTSFEEMNGLVWYERRTY